MPGGSSSSRKGKESNHFGFLFCVVLRKMNFKKIDPVVVTWAPETGGVCSHLSN